MIYNMLSTRTCIQTMLKLNGHRRQNSNSKTSVLKDSSVGSIWTYLTASPCYATNTETERDRQADRQTDRVTD